jgi:hypothetical protein
MGVQQKTSTNLIFSSDPGFSAFALGATADRSAENDRFGGASFANVEQEITEITERKPADLEGRCLQAADFQVLPLFKSERRRGKGQRNDGQGNGGQRVMGWFGFGDVFSGTRRARGGGFRACCSADF